MPTISDPVPGQQEQVVTGIYIARGSDTLGPYNSLEAAALVVGGYLRPDDYAARNGDPTWVALTHFLPLSTVPLVTAPAPTQPITLPASTPPHRWRQLAAAFAILLVTPLLVAGGVHWFKGRRTATDANVPAPPQGERASGAASPAPAQLLPAVHEAELVPAVSGPVQGSVSFVLPGGERVSLAGIHISVYPLAVLEPVLAREATDAQAARSRLDPQIAAADQERANRASEAQATLKTLHEANPADPLTASLRFANQAAKTAVKTAEDDYRYLVDERATAAGGEYYLHGLPAPAATVDTDAQGNFILTALPGDEPFALAASVRTTADDGSVRSRYWLLKLSPAQRAGREGLRLDDGNSSSSPAAESLIHTAD